MKGLLVLLCIVLSFKQQATGQPVDSLMAVLDTATNERKVKTLNELFRANIQSDPVKAIGYTREALNLASEINDKRGQAAAYNNLGVAYRNQGALDKALQYYITSLKIYEQLDNKEGIATTKNNIATIYSMKKDYGQAMKFLEESHNLFIQLGDQAKIIGSMNNLGNLNSDLQLYEKAMRYFSEAYQLSQKMGKPFADPVNNIGNVYFRQGNYQRAIEHYQRALEIETENNNRLGMLNAVTNIGIAYTKAGQPKPAQEYLTQAEKLAKELRAYTGLPDILKNNSINFYRMGKLKEAYEVLLKYDSAREKIYGEESSRSIAQMEIALELNEKEKEYEILRKQAEINALQLRNSRLFIVLSILGLLVIIAAVNFYFMNKRREFIKS
ncbi:MAG: tetratricopeptide repeat protein [Flammeovirgaceae bacterium]|nr:MAG: tetratricopeptide repeat protein [Flammeovirgaceae bacterium]